MRLLLARNFYINQKLEVSNARLENEETNRGEEK